MPQGDDDQTLEILVVVSEYDKLDSLCGVLWKREVNVEIWASSLVVSYLISFCRAFDIHLVCFLCAGYNVFMMRQTWENTFTFSMTTNQSGVLFEYP